ncbi:uncharacterized protein MEPE_04580 [Melanopsichium pennsylvanicum]|uniref:Uncharacterized protein n=2 Tax=Melanopsichium pennsylvanicum TaxID=63383 RepID=A0AAJ4XQ53_9BASI|nr:hypothetical protein BN887_01227 [Melanopsichium pennsylvanicum 4]SNX85871.1 uncharacterized protein MEPE_04580 [Melanopsichium pennsylvanicum]
MWPGTSSKWRAKRSITTRPRLGINKNPPRPSSSNRSPSKSPEGGIFNDLDPMQFEKRQLDDEAATDDDGGVAAATTYDNGLWTPPASATIPSFTATVAFSTSIQDTELSSMPSLTSSILTSSASSDSVASSKPTSSFTLSQSSASLSTTSDTSSSASPSASSASPQKSSGDGSGFKLIYLTPIVVFAVLLLIASIVGRIWGRYQHAARVQNTRRVKQDERASRAAKKREMQRIKTLWGYDLTPVLPPEIEAGEHDLHYSDPNAPAKRKNSKHDDGGDSSFGSDSDSGEGTDEKYPGMLKILSLALLGEGRKPEPPQIREGGKRGYEERVQQSSWLSVKIQRWIGATEREPEDTRYTVPPSKSSRRLRHALSQGRMLTEAMNEYQEKDSHLSASSPATTLSAGSGEIKYKAEFANVYLDHNTFPTSPCQFGSFPRTENRAEELDDPFAEKVSLGIRKPLPPQPKESPFRPAMLNFGLRSRSKTYDPVALSGEANTPIKPTNSRYTPVLEEAAGGWPKTFGLGISGVWKTLTAFTTGQQGPVNGEDEESFVGFQCRHSSELMSESDTPYSHQKHLTSHDRCDMGTPTKQLSQLCRSGTVLQVKSTNQPWSAGESRKMTTSAWNEALLASPVNKQQQNHVYQPLIYQSPTKTQRNADNESSLAPRKSLLLQQAIKANNGELDITSPAFTDYSDLVACYSTPSDAIKSPDAASIRVLPLATKLDEETAGPREKLQRAKTAKHSSAATGGVADVHRSKTASINTTETNRVGASLSRKGTVHHSMLKKSLHSASCSSSRGDEVEKEKFTASPSSKQSKGSMYPYSLTEPLRVSKPAELVNIPSRGSSSPMKPASPFKASTKITNAAPLLPSSLRIASPEPLIPPQSHVFHRGSMDITHQGLASFHPHYKPGSSSQEVYVTGGCSPPKRSKAVSNRSTIDTHNEHDKDEQMPMINTTARVAVRKAQNRSTALQEVDQIIFAGYNNGYQSQH